MKRLIAVNEKLAVYYQNSSRLEKLVDPRKYLSDLLGIRSALGLVRFLKNYPHDLGGPVNKDLIAYCNDESRGPTGQFSFSSAALDTATQKCNVDYFDAMVNLDSHKNDQRLIDELSSNDYCFLEIEKLERLSDHVQSLLLMALTHYGKGVCNDQFEFETHDEFSVLSISWEHIMTLCPDPMDRLDLHYSFLGPDLMRVGSTKAIAPSETGLRFSTESNFETAAQEAAGILTALALTRWLDRFGSPTHVACSHEGTLELRNSEVREVPMELAKIVIERRIGICDRCGKPFIAKRMSADGKPAKMRCSDSCTTIASRDR